MRISDWSSDVCSSDLLKERTVYDLVARKAIPCSRVTGKLIFPRRLIDRWVDANAHFATGPIAVPPPILRGSSDPLLEWASRASGSGLANLFAGCSTEIEKESCRDEVVKES